MLDNMLLLNWWVATGILILEIAAVGKLISLIIISGWLGENLQNLYKKLVTNVSEKILKKFNVEVRGERFLLVCIFLFSLFSTILSLVYSEYFQQIPCALCWWQRIFIYGVVVLSASALVQTAPGLRLAPSKEGELIVQKFQLNNVLVFSVGGLLFGLYQHAEQILALYGTNLPCPVSGADCARMTIFEYGHITFPWTAVVLCGFFIIIILLQRKLK